MQRLAPRMSHAAYSLCLPAMLALPALAGTPEALDHVPSDSQAVIVVPELGELLSDINTINAIMGDQGEPMVMMMTSMIRGMPGINLDGSMAVVMAIEPGQEEPDAVMLVPVSDFEAFTQGREPEGGVVEFPIGDGEMMYARNAGGGYAVFGQIADDVRGFDASAGQGTAHAKALGKSGGRIADDNDIFFYVNIPQFQDEIAMGISEMEAQGEMIEMMGGAEAAQGFDQMMNMVKTVADDALSFAAGVSFDPQTGFAMDVGFQFKQDSASAAYLNNNGNAAKYFSHAPAMDYFFAAAYDMSGDGIQKFMGEYVGWIEKMDSTGMTKAMDLPTLMGGLKGGIQVMGASDNVMGGLFNNTVYYADVENPKEYINSMRSMFSGMNESMKELEQAGVSVSAEVDEDSTEIEGFNAFGYQFAMDMSQMGQMNGGMGAGPNPAMIMQMMFGADGGPSGYVAEAGDGLVMTLSRDAGLFARAAEAANGKNTMSADASIKQTASMLPDNRIMEMYIAADHLANTAGPMAMMFGLIPEFEPVAPLPPMGMGLTADGGGMLFRTVLPNKTIHAIMDMVPEDAWQGEDDDEPMDF